MSPARLLEATRTARDTGEWLTGLPTAPFGRRETTGAPSIVVDSSTRYQAIEGFGGAFTEAAAVTFGRLDPVARAALVRACFDPVEGNGYTLCRTTINSCDFALGNYAYDETPGDVGLADFSIEHDRRALIPLIKAAMHAAGGRLALLASPWSPPAWMKTNGEMNGGGSLRPEYRAAWARYYTRYVRAYEAEGIPIWGLTVQNEPEATQTWDSCRYTAEEERDFVRDFLGPELEAAGLGDLRLLVHDHNRDQLFARAKTIYDDPAAARYVWGAGFHWYGGDNFDNVQRLHDAFPERHLLFTEGCQEGGPHAGEWAVGERYGCQIIGDLNRWTVGWIDWNLLLDERGGPNHAGNYCSAPILVEARDGGPARLAFQSSYAYIGHFSRFIRPGARRVIAAPDRDDLETTAFVNPDGRIAVVVLNRTDKDIALTLRYGGQAASTEAPPHSITTYVFDA